MKYYSNGKILLTGEYVVLDGAKALALPTRFGQSLEVREGDQPGIMWTAFDHDDSVWIERHYSFEELESGMADPQDRLLQVLRAAHAMNSDILTPDSSFSVTTRLTFPHFWGLGTSSTLLCNVASWFEIDPYALLEKTFGGSGYDIACGLHDRPLLYRLEYGLPTVEEVSFSPSFAGDLYFVYLNRKQDSREAISAYRRQPLSNINEILLEIDDCTRAMLEAPSREAFTSALRRHETVLSTILQTLPVKERLFADYNGDIKSLGGWGGDFVLAVSETNPEAYFSSKGYRTVIPYERFIKR